MRAIGHESGSSDRAESRVDLLLIRTRAMLLCKVALCKCCPSVTLSTSLAFDSSFCGTHATIQHKIYISGKPKLSAFQQCKNHAK